MFRRNVNYTLFNKFKTFNINFINVCIIINRVNIKLRPFYNLPNFTLNIILHTVVNVIRKLCWLS
ncbi:hypothetical protein D3C81_926800 [compost metagenome]